MGMDPSTPEIKLPDIAKVTEPRSPDDFGTVFIDTQSYRDALEETVAEDRKGLLDLARFDELITALNRYVQDYGYVGRLTTLLLEIRSVAREARAILLVDMPEERAAIELSSRKRKVVTYERISRLGCESRSDIGVCFDRLNELRDGKIPEIACLELGP